MTKHSDPQVVGGGKTKQDVIIKDSTGSATLTIWENDVGSLKLGDLHQLNQVMVHTFKGKATTFLFHCQEPPLNPLYREVHIAHYHVSLGHFSQ